MHTDQLESTVSEVVPRGRLLVLTLLLHHLLLYLCNAFAWRRRVALVPPFRRIGFHNSRRDNVRRVRLQQGFVHSQGFQNRLGLLLKNRCRRFLVFNTRLMVFVHLLLHHGSTLLRSGRISCATLTGDYLLDVAVGGLNSVALHLYPGGGGAPTTAPDARRLIVLFALIAAPLLQILLLFRRHLILRRHLLLFLLLLAVKRVIVAPIEGRRDHLSQSLKLQTLLFGPFIHVAIGLDVHGGTANFGRFDRH